MNKSNQAKVLFGTLTIGALISFIWLSPTVHVEENLTQTNDYSEANIKSNSMEISAPIMTMGYGADPFVRSLIQQLKARHQHNIQDVKVQATLLDLKKMLAERYPTNYSAIFEFILEQAFPAKAEQILALVEKLERYQDWYQTNLAKLAAQSHSDRHQAIWQKRYAIFSQLADALWPSEQPSQLQQDRREQLQLTLQALNTDVHSSMEEKLYILSSTLNENTDASTFSELTNQATVANLFFGLDSVQNNLKSMSADERQSAINDARRKMGYSEADINELAQEDSEKESRWQNGYRYMEKRNDLVASLSGKSLETALAQLRDSHFQREASTIAAEEKSGFFRYQRPRYYGRN